MIKANMINIKYLFRKNKFQTWSNYIITNFRSYAFPLNFVRVISVLVASRVAGWRWTHVPFEIKIPDLLMVRFIVNRNKERKEKNINI